ncbi:methionine--tRNA ligase [Candidatus Parcubacteria bacterium]|nr:methionine--tRNA ligase [Candidatus Parcubacteria bacterium]
MSKPFYLTTTLPYVNAEPHIGFALEIVQADAIVRYHALMGEEVFFNTGTDEHGLKIFRKAEEEGKDTQEYVDFFAAKFRDLKEKLNLYPGLTFIRTTDAKHKAAAQEFWRRCLANGDIYKKDYQVKYCVGCELEKTDSELENGKCPIHPNLEIETIKEENYFFRWSKYQKPLEEFYTKNPNFVVPDYRFNEIKAFVARGLEDFSISRLKEKMPWGIAVPGDDTQVMYVWFDALVNYISTLNWPQEEGVFAKFWGTKEFPNAVQVAGKDNLRQQSAMWQAMLLSAGLPASKQIVIHGFITSGGQKMSKSLGNVINPMSIVEEYGSDALRYFLLRHIHPFEDSDFTMERFKEMYNAGLANGLGNLSSRVMMLAEKHLVSPIDTSLFAGMPEEYTRALEGFEYTFAMDYVWKKIQELNQRIEKEEPFKLIKTDEEAGKKLIAEMTSELYRIAGLLSPFLPQTSMKIKEAVETNKKPENLFPRKD